MWYYIMVVSCVNVESLNACIDLLFTSYRIILQLYTSVLLKVMLKPHDVSSNIMLM